MIRRDIAGSYRELADAGTEERTCTSVLSDETGAEQDDVNGTVIQDDELGSTSLSSIFGKTCLKNTCAVILIFIYLLLMSVAVFLAYQTITDFREKFKHPVMSVSFQEVLKYDAPGIALYPGNAELQSCKHHYHDYVQLTVNPGQRGEIDCTFEHVNYTDPYRNKTLRSALVIRGPQEVKKKELVFLQFHLNETEENFSAISYLLFSSFKEFQESSDKAQFMQDCERSYSIWTFSGGFQTWVKMSLVKTTEEDGSESVEFKQESTLVKYNDHRPVSEQTDQLFFVVFEWKDPFIQEVRDIITANPWNTIAILCGVFLALFKAAEFAKLSVKWMIKIKKRQQKRKAQELNQMS
ncbi:proton-activated chloride channel isoform X1 [Scyliorhinus canicula]|uniref:proton-activated chloride channel isoform X1 n=2 Tax=Scyliorhinus canicula TaxID=7830 RepID=UPI0018F4D86E|nr:proton-activated chloride channel isoform X1 [Scyliorhinus canicula]